MKKMTFLVLIAVLSGCATPYQASGLRGGYEDSDLGSDRYLVSFSGNAHTSQAMVQSYALRRAKELCTENGFTSFEMLGLNGQTDHKLAAGFNGEPVTQSRHTATATVQCKNRTPASAP